MGDWLPTRYRTNLMYVPGTDRFFVRKEHKLFHELEGLDDHPIDNEWYKTNESALRRALEKNTIVKPQRKRSKSGKDKDHGSNGS